MAKAAVTDQANNFFKRLTASQKILIVSVVGLVLVGMIVIFISTSKVDLGVLYSSLEQSDASRITAFLKERNIEYQLDDNGTTILVDKDIVHDTRLELAGEGWPDGDVDVNGLPW